MGIYDTELAATVEEFPKFTVVRKSDSDFMKLIALLLEKVFGNKSFMGSFITTIGDNMWVPDAWDNYTDYDRAEIVRHERVHLRQQRRYGMLLYAALYLLVPLPILYAWGRYMLEREAYEETLQAQAEYYGVEYIKDPSNRDFILSVFTDNSYGWMWSNRKDVERWYDKAVCRISNQRQ